MSKPATNHRDIDSCRYQRDRSRVAKLVWGNSFIGQGRNLLGCRRHVFLQLEANAGCSEGASVAVHEEALILSVGLAFLKRPLTVRPSRATADRFVLFALWRTRSTTANAAGTVKPSGLRIHTTRCPDESTSSSRTATAGEAIASISTTTQADCGRSLPVGPTLWRTIRLWLWLLGDPRSAWPICSRSPI